MGFCDVAEVGERQRTDGGQLRDGRAQLKLATSYCSPKRLSNEGAPYAPTLELAPDGHDLPHLIATRANHLLNGHHGDRQRVRGHSKFPPRVE